jgi:hypothetical protein
MSPDRSSLNYIVQLLLNSVTNTCISSPNTLHVVFPRTICYIYYTINIFLKEFICSWCEIQTMHNFRGESQWRKVDKLNS